MERISIISEFHTCLKIFFLVAGYSQCVSSASAFKGNMSRIPGSHFKSRVLLHNEYIFHKNKHVKKTGTTYYVCRTRDCHATGVAKPGKDFRQTQSHNGHPQCELAETKSHFIERLKERAEQEDTPLKEIYLEESQRPE
jgi:hypothetical protein